MEVVNTVIDKNFIAHDKDDVTLEVLAIIGLGIEYAVMIASKIYKVRKGNSAGFYSEALPKDTKELVQNKYFNNLLDKNGQYLNEECLEFLLPDEDEQEHPPLDDMKHKIYHIRRRARERYYGEWLSDFILNCSSKEIYNMMFYDVLNTKGKCR